MNGNKMGVLKINKLIWTMGLPMILSMVLQAVYNVVDTVFVINMDPVKGITGNLALTYAFPVQIVIIAVGVGTGVGINAMLSMNLGKGDKKMVDRTAGNGIFLALCIYLIFLLFGLFLAKPYAKMMAGDNAEAAAYTEQYLKICCCLSFGSVGYTVYERFLQATGKTMQSTIAQISGAITNIGLDALFIYGFKWEVAGAAWATIIGQILSLAVAMIFHYAKNKEIGNHPANIRPSWAVIKLIYKIGLPAAIMQALLAAMMFTVLAIFKTADNVELLSGAYGIYYKIMQMALFACFGLSNTLITVTSFNYGMKDYERVRQTAKYGIIDSVIVAALITILFQVLARPISNLFGMSVTDTGTVTKDEIISACTYAMHFATIGYIFMAVSVGAQGVLQGFNSVFKPLIISLLRLIVFVVPFVLLFVHLDHPEMNVWWSFTIAEVLTSVVSVFLLRGTLKKKLPQKATESAGM